MVRLGRHVRFSIDPFLDHDDLGFNSYASKPSGAGLSLFLELDVELVGPVASDTGLLVNVSDIDRAVRRFALPIFAEQIRAHMRSGKHIGLAVVAQMLRLAGERLRDKFAAAQVDRLRLQLNPFRKLAMNTQAPHKIYFSEKFEFAATHKLWNDELAPRQNLEVFGKCANPAGHGHNYIVEVTVEAPAAAPGLKIGEFESVVDSRLMQLLDHRNLNVDVPAFQQKTPTVENIAAFAWERLVGQFGSARLHDITVWESDRTYCSYRGADAD